MLNTVSVTEAVEDFNEEFSLSRRAYGQDPSLTATWVGVSLTFQGLLQVAREPEKVKQDLTHFGSFVKGADGMAASLGDEGRAAPRTGSSARTAPAYTPYCSSPRTPRRRSTKSSGTSPRRIRRTV